MLTDLHARDVSIDVAQHALLQHRKVVEVPSRVDVLLDKKVHNIISALAIAVMETMHQQEQSGR